MFSVTCVAFTFSSFISSFFKIIYVDHLRSSHFLIQMLLLGLLAILRRFVFAQTLCVCVCICDVCACVCVCMCDVCVGTYIW